MQYGENLDLALLNLTKNIIDNYKFDCGNDYINKYFKKPLSKKETADFVYIDNKTDKLVAYYSLNCSAIMIDSKSELINLVPAVEISVFALATDYQGLPMQKDTDYNLSNYIMDEVIKKISLFTREQCGSGRVVLYSVPEAYDFYVRNEFEDFVGYMKPAASRITEDCIPMFFRLK